MGSISTMKGAITRGGAAAMAGVEANSTTTPPTHAAISDVGDDVTIDGIGGQVGEMDVEVGTNRSAPGEGAQMTGARR